MTRLPRWLPLVAALASLVHSGCAWAAAAPAASSFDSNGVKIAYSVQGQGEPVVLIHGWLASAGTNWGLTGISSLLAQNNQVVALDVRGHGRSDQPTRLDAYGPELVDDVVRLLDHLQIEKAHIVGYSMGGIIAANFIVKHPDRVLTGTLGGMGWMQTGSIGQFTFARIGKNDVNPKPVTLCGQSLAQLALTEAEIKSIRVPMTVLVGDRDDLIQTLYVAPLRKVRGDWPVIEIKDATHITCVLKPQFRAAIAAWLKQNSE